MVEPEEVCRHLLIGLPATGKTTFLAALWHLVESAEIPEALRLVKLEGDREYINGLTRRWMRCESLSRTPVSTETLVSMRLRETNASREMEIAFPDLSGEVFRQQWTERAWSSDYEELVLRASGALLFVHPDQITEPYRIDQADSLVAAAGGEASGPAAGNSAPVQWSHDMAPTQVVLTDLLQFMQVRRGSEQPLKLGVIVSAWDLVEDQTSDPASWFGSRLPLLAQFLECNNLFWSTRIYGVSAQGGDLDRDKVTLLQHHAASERLRISGPETTEHDLTGPLKWLLG